MYRPYRKSQTPVTVEERFFLVSFFRLIPYHRKNVLPGSGSQCIIGCRTGILFGRFSEDQDHGMARRPQLRDKLHGYADTLGTYLPIYMDPYSGRSSMPVCCMLGTHRKVAPRLSCRSHSSYESDNIEREPQRVPVNLDRWSSLKRMDRCYSDADLQDRQIMRSLTTRTGIGALANACQPRPPG